MRGLRVIDLEGTSWVKKTKKKVENMEGWRVESLKTQGRAGLASMWIHLNRVRSTFSKSVADTSGRFLSHRRGRREKKHGEVGQGRNLQLAAGAPMPGAACSMARSRISHKGI